MKLREHPQLFFSGRPYWPPVWVRTQSTERKILTGEVGTLTGTKYYDQAPSRVFITMEFNGEPYMGCLLVRDFALSRELHNLLQQHIGRSMSEIGDLDLSYTL